MPRTHGFRRHKAAQLVKLIEEGPSLSDMHDQPYTPEKVKRDVRRWLYSWVLPLVKELVPELKEKK